MPIQVTKLSEQGFLVNGKAIYLNEQGIWIPEIKFEYFEIDAFKKHLNAVQKDFKISLQNIDDDSN